MDEFQYLVFVERIIKKLKMTFDPTVNLGNILTLGASLAAIVLYFGRSGKEVESIKEDIEEIKDTIKDLVTTDKNIAVLNQRVIAIEEDIKASTISVIQQQVMVLQKEMDRCRANIHRIANDIHVKFLAEKEDVDTKYSK